jgi:hypothetical protein
MHRPWRCSSGNCLAYISTPLLLLLTLELLCCLCPQAVTDVVDCATNGSSAAVLHLFPVVAVKPRTFLCWVCFASWRGLPSRGVVTVLQEVMAPHALLTLLLWHLEVFGCTPTHLAIHTIAVDTQASCGFQEPDHQQPTSTWPW